MGLTTGIVGLPNVGKSTLFNAITKTKVLAANYPFATIEPNVGIVEVKDERLDYLVKLFNPKSIVPAIVSFTDIAGLVKGASQGEGLGNQFLSHIRDVDAICEVVRCFDSTDIIHVEGSVDPIRDIETINLELAIADLEIVQKRIPKIEKKAQMKVDLESEKEYALLKKLEAHLQNGLSIRSCKLDSEEAKAIKEYHFLTSKPIIYVANVSEDDASSGNSYVDKVKDYAKKENAEVVTICAKLEEELSELDDETKKEFLSTYGLNESGLDVLIKKAYSLLGLKTFLTGGADECRAWTFKDGMKAPECAGIIHSDFERGFIRAETYSYSDLQTYGTPLKVREAGKIRQEGKDYVVQDGDILFFKFNV